MDQAPIPGACLGIACVFGALTGALLSKVAHSLAGAQRALGGVPCAGTPIELQTLCRGNVDLQGLYKGIYAGHICRAYITTYMQGECASLARTPHKRGFFLQGAQCGVCLLRTPAQAPARAHLAVAHIPGAARVARARALLERTSLTACLAAPGGQHVAHSE